jgi:uncharacterized membrane protein
MTDKPEINGCLSPALFKNPIGLFVVSALQIVALLFINIFYISAVVILKRLTTHQVAGTSSNRQKINQRAFFHLLAVLMVTNITTLPAIVLAFVLDPRKTDETIMHVIPTLQALNLLINHVLYSAHIKEIRTTIKEKLLSCLMVKEDQCNVNGGESNTNEAIGQSKSACMQSYDTGSSSISGSITIESADLKE